MPRGIYSRKKTKKKNSSPAIQKLRETIKSLQHALNILQTLERNG